jgi:oligopeptidase A
MAPRLGANDSQIQKRRRPSQDKRRKREVHSVVELELNSLAERFVDNVMNDTYNVSVYVDVDDRDRLDGIPESALELARQRAVANGDKKGWRFFLDPSSYLPVITYARDRSLREALFKASRSKASKGNTDDTSIMERMLELRHQKARMLGYEHYAQLSCDSKMASFPEASRLLEDLSSSSVPAARRELEDVKEFARSNGHPEDDDDFKWWDIIFWSERLRESRYYFREDVELRPYMTLDNVLRGLTSLTDRLFGVTLRELDPDTMRDLDIQTWHPHVRVFSVKSSERDHKERSTLAFVFLDPYSRPGSKKAGAWMQETSIRSGCPSYEENNGLERLFRVPIANVVCNFSVTEQRPVFLTIEEAQELFHEFGHALQHVLTQEGCGLVSGYPGIEWDAVEVPSRFMENWFYDKYTFQQIARHHETGEIAPDAIFEKMLSARTFFAAYRMQREVHYARMDLELHSAFSAEEGTETVFERERVVAQKTLVMPQMPDDRYLCSFTHVFEGSYDAGYYSYVWAEVLSSDAFSAFEEIFRDESLNEEEKERRVRETGRRFRDTVLARGGGDHPSHVFRAFRGRDPVMEPLLRKSGCVT